jgi:integrase
MATRNSTSRVNFTKGRVDAFACPADKNRLYLWDSGQPGLGLLATPPKGESEGAVSYVFQRKLGGRSVRLTIGDRATWTLEKARDEARRMGVLVDSGIDPRQERKERLAQTEAARLEAIRSTVTLGEAWTVYVEARSADWSEGHKRDHEQVMAAPGRTVNRKRKSKAGPLYPLRDERLEALTPARLERWLENERKTRPAFAARAFRLLRACLRWAEGRSEYSGLADPARVLTQDVRRKVPRVGARDDCLQREQLSLWFEAVQKIPNPVVSTYLQGLLLTGARSGELAQLQWKDVDFQWRSLTLRDKVEGERTIPLPPYLASLLHALPRRTLGNRKPNPWVFSSPITEHGRMGEANHAHSAAVKDAGLPPLTQHGLRRSFGTLSEWVECPVGVVAQIQGHKPSAIAEKHYRRRPLDLLRQWHDKIEGWILTEAGIERPQAGTAALRVVK